MNSNQAQSSVCGSRPDGIPVLVMATNNPHKLSEARRICEGKLQLMSLADIGCHEDIPETGVTLKENALQKARWVKERYGYDCLADDTGLMVDCLDGAPGVYSARYAGEAHDSKANMEKLLRQMEGFDNRKAHFSTVLALLIGNQEYFLEGRVDGEIARSEAGGDGFGYDPVFRPEGSELTFAQMSPSEKNKLSHRARAMTALMGFFNERNQKKY